MTRSDEPPDWALPAWDSLGIGGGSSQGSSAGPGPGTPAGSLLPPPTRLRILGVSEVTRAVRDAIRGDDRLRDVWVEGEVGRVTVSSAGHGYFNLKDERSQLSCIWFRDDRLSSPFEAQVGLRIVAHGRLDVFEPGGAYQLYVSAIQPAGSATWPSGSRRSRPVSRPRASSIASASGPIPERPAVIAVVTSATGAVLHDIRRVVGRRWPLARLVLSPCLVQGDGAAASIAKALDRVDRAAARAVAAGHPEDVAVVTIVARGGGSLEDLWAFNEEVVVRAIVAHGRPVVAGIGHETDVTLTDFAADVRAPTPSAAAELVVPDRAEVVEHVGRLARRAETFVLRRLGTLEQALLQERRALIQLHPAAQLAAAQERSGRLLDRATAAVVGGLDRRTGRLDRVGRRAPVVVGGRVEARAARLGRAGAALTALGPQATLERGYAIVRRRADARILRDPSDARPGTALAIRLAQGDLAATVDSDSG